MDPSGGGGVGGISDEQMWVWGLRLRGFTARPGGGGVARIGVGRGLIWSSRRRPWGGGTGIREGLLPPFGDLGEGMEKSCGFGDLVL